MNAPSQIRLQPVETRGADAWRDGQASRIERVLADEAPVGLSYDGKPYVVLMASPADVEDLAVGFSVTERMADSSQIEAITVEALEEGLSVDITLNAEGRKARGQARLRTLEGRSSCGLCGVQRLKSAVRPVSPVGAGINVTREAVQAALAALDDAQTLGRMTRAMHAAALADPDGNLLLVREDVGRHNALDKLIGAALRQGLDLVGSFLVLTSRCSYEMIEKAAVAGVSVVVAISAPTALALRKAEEADITLIALARSDGHMVFTRPDRIL
jgi:FdhD protein